MIEKDNVLQYAKRNNIKISEEDVDDALKMNREEIIKSIKDKYTYEIWDNKTSINGVKAEDIINSRNYKIGKAYLIYIDGDLTFFQDHNPEKVGYEKMTKTEAEKFAKKKIDELIENTVDTIILDKIINQK